MLEGQLMELHTSAQNMANRYGTENIQTLLVANLNRDREEPKPEKKTNDDEVNRRLEEMSQELRIVKGKNERELGSLLERTKHLEETHDGRAG